MFLAGMVVPSNIAPDPEISVELLVVFLDSVFEMFQKDLVLFVSFVYFSPRGT